jgi:hypothetical protein
MLFSTQTSLTVNGSLTAMTDTGEARCWPKTRCSG